jgi:hypothetical protein
MKSQEAAKRATVTAERALEMEAQLKEAEQRAADAERRAAETAQPVTNRDSADPTIAAKLKRTEDERDQFKARLGQLEHATTKGSATSAKGDGSKRGSRSSKAPAAQTTSSSDERRSRSRTPG